MNRSKTIEVMAEALCFVGKACDRHCPDVDHRPCPDALSSWGKDAERVFARLHAEGMAVVPGWQPIESAPKDAAILVVDADGDVNKASWGDCCPGYPNSPNMKWCVACSHSEYGYVTTKAVAWMPLPAAASPSGKPVVKEKGDE